MVIPIIIPMSRGGGHGPSGYVPPRQKSNWFRDQYGMMHLRWWMAIVLVPTILLIFGGAFFMASLGQRDFDSWCTPKGGHYVYSGKHGGLCVSTDGRIIEP